MSSETEPFETSEPLPEYETQNAEMNARDMFETMVRFE